MLRGRGRVRGRDGRPLSPVRSRPPDAPVLHLDRLGLVLLTQGCLDALVHGRLEEAAALVGAAIPADWPDERDRSLLRRRLEQIEDDPRAGEWLLRGLVLASTRELAGHVGFHGPPGVNGLARAEAVELGYTVLPPYRGRGLATEAAGGLIRWAAEEHGVRSFLASAAPENHASLAVLRKLGFVQVGEQWDDEDGLELVFELELRPAPRPVWTPPASAT